VAAGWARCPGFQFRPLERVSAAMWAEGARAELVSLLGFLHPIAQVGVFFGRQRAGILRLLHSGRLHYARLQLRMDAIRERSTDDLGVQVDATLVRMHAEDRRN